MARIQNSQSAESLTIRHLGKGIPAKEILKCSVADSQGSTNLRDPDSKQPGNCDAKVSGSHILSNDYVARWSMSQCHALFHLLNEEARSMDFECTLELSDRRMEKKIWTSLREWRNPSLNQLTAKMFISPVRFHIQKVNDYSFRSPKSLKFVSRR
jgi:hypothetical protein